MKYLDQYENVFCLIDIYWDTVNEHYIARNANNPKEILFELDKKKNNSNPLDSQHDIPFNDFENEAIIELKDLTESESKKVSVRYTNFDFNGQKKVAFQYINHLTKFLYAEIKEKLMMPIEDPLVGVLDEIHIDDIIHSVKLDYTITNNDTLIISEEDFIRRTNQNYSSFQKNKNGGKEQKVLWLFDNNKYLVCNANISLVPEGKYKDQYCIKLKSNTSMYVEKYMLEEFLKAEEYINRNKTIKNHKMIMEFFWPDKKFFLSDVEISNEPFKIFGVEYYRVKYHSGFYEFLKKNEFERRLLINYKNNSSSNIISWNDLTYKLNVNDRIVLVWCFYSNNRETDNEYIYSEYKVLDFIKSDSLINNEFIELYNLNNHNKFGLDIESISKRLCSINGISLPDKSKSEEYSFINSSKERKKMKEFI